MYIYIYIYICIYLYIYIYIYDTTNIRSKATTKNSYIKSILA